MSRDTTAIGAEARAVESGVVGWLRRVKECAPGGELPSRQYRKSFDDDHGSGTFWTAETSGLGGGGSEDFWEWGRLGMMKQELLTERELITDMQTPIQSGHLVWWPMWRVNSEIVFHNQLFFFAKHRVEGSYIDVKRLYEFIGNRFPHNDEGTPVSEWTVPVSEVKRFIDSAKNVWPPHHPRHR